MPEPSARHDIEDRPVRASPVKSTRRLVDAPSVRQWDLTHSKCDTPALARKVNGAMPHSIGHNQIAEMRGPNVHSVGVDSIFEASLVLEI